MGKHERLLQTIIRGRSDASIRFADLRALLLHLGFSERIRGSHHLFDEDGIVEILNLQSRGGQVKPYQARQARNLLLKYKLGAEN